MSTNILNRDLGCYYPSLFRMNLDFEFPEALFAILRLPPNEQGAFVHEYIHFIQDISTFFGLNNMYVYAEYLHSTIASIGKQNNKKITIPQPIPKHDKDNVKINQDIAKICTGDFESVDSFVIGRIEEVFVDKNTPIGRLKIPAYKLVSGKNKVKFGGRALMESMAFLIEEILVPKSGGAKDFPYHSAELVADYYYPSFSQDRLRLIAMCDVSLLMSNPAKIFIETLKQYQSLGIMPSPEEIYDNFYSTPKSLMGKVYTTENALFMFYNKMEKYLSQYVSEDFDKSFSEIMHRLISLTLMERLANKTFIIDICKAGDIFHNLKFIDLVNRYGSPLIRDSNNNYSLIPPIGNTGHLQFSLSYFYAIEQIYNTLYEGADCCDLLEWCETSDEISPQAPQIDDRCINEPWKRCNDSYLCPYAAIWRHWNLRDIKVKKRVSPTP